ncbi:Gfo/Idh/MocA family protein [Labedella endophytica]|uniref:Gfo/Idh/MocA family oxidoreductase n=1 Tax=Labedella endophytica TaxID=1523160 RepID=A0A433JVR1_9MICO|nr:Gfo/Idh/MocA family oxidoreductase [Labedella endophytica]RUR03027.1 Gfo/Idh/MocA family oxidoreductase [Labedella endophytica]
MPLNVIHVGLGGWGGNWAQIAIPRVPEVEVVAVVDIDADTRASVLKAIKRPGLPGFASLGEALGAVDADAVVITAPAVTHVPLALEALDAGKHVLVEKPFANTAEEAAVAVRRAAEKDLVMQVSQNYRFYPAPRAVQRLLTAGELGELSAINIDFRQWDNDAAYAANRHYKFPHPLINDMAIHHFDLLRKVTGQEAVSVFAKVGDPSFSKFDEEASAVIIIELESGLVVSYRGSWVSRGVPTAWAGEWAIDGEKGQIEFTSRLGDNPAGDRVSLRRPKGKPVAVDLEDMPLWGRSAGLQHFAQAIASGTTPETAGAGNLGSLALMEAAARSAVSGRTESVVIPTV